MTLISSPMARFQAIVTCIGALQILESVVVSKDVIVVLMNTERPKWLRNA